jgi:D-alanine-D-alanine ligase
VSHPAVIFGGPSPEHDISILTGLQAARALADLGRPPMGLYWSKTGEWFEVDPASEGKDFVDGPPRKARPLRLVVGPGGGFVGDGGALRKEKAADIEAAVVCCHGAPGEDGSLQAALDLAGIAYTGPDVAGAALGMDKLAFGAVAAQAGLPVLPRVAASQEPPPFEGPYIVKPRFGGSSIGIATVADAAAIGTLLKQSVHLRAGAVVEPYRPGSVDLEVGVRAYPSLELSAISEPERTGAPGEIYSYQQKYVGGEGMASAPRQTNPDLPGETAKLLREVATTIASLVRVRGVARVDFLLDADDELYLNEINTIPGSLARHLWVDPPIAFGVLLTDLLAEAAARPTTAWTTAGADGTALRSAGTIASKLG